MTQALLRSVYLIAVLAFLIAAPSAIAQDVEVQVDGLDAIGDSGYAPDIGKVQHSVRPHDGNRTVVVGIWLDRSNLVADERVSLYFNTQAGGDPTFGGEYLFFLHGYDDPAADLYWTYAWAQGQGWVHQAIANTRVDTYPDGRMYFTLDFQPGSPIGLRVASTRPASSGFWFDYVPDSSNMFLSLEPHGLADPLEGCTWDGGCVGGGSGPGLFGPQTNAPSGNKSGSGNPSPAGRPSAACTRAQKKLRTARRKLSRARSQSRSSRASYLGKVNSLKKLINRRKRAVRARC